MTDRDFDSIFTKDKPIVFAFHGYPWLIHRLTYRRTNHDNLHVRGYKEEGTTTTPFDMTVMNDLDRFHLAGDVIDRVPAPARDRRALQAGPARQADRAQAVHRTLRRRHAGDSRLEVGEPGAASMKALVLNAGSSSLKVSLFEIAAPVPEFAPAALWDVSVEWRPHDPPGAALDRLAEKIGDPRAIDAVGHRIVHGGDAFHESVRITPEVEAAIARFGSLAPEHNRLEAAMIDAAQRIFGPGTLQVAAFDTAFHSTLRPAAYVYPGPYGWLAEGIRRYGFHGISHQYVSLRAAAMLGGKCARMITCHLGNGCSLAAIRDGVSVDTSMGYTPLEGLMMGTRSGSVDPGILIHLLRDRGMSVEDVDRILNRESGLRGVSGVSGDMREIIAAMARGDERAQLAFDLFAHRLSAGIAGLIPSLGGLDALVFTAGVGENSAPVRAAACAALAFLGVKVDPGKNDPSPAEDADIAAADSAVRILVVHTREQWQIAKDCYRLHGSAKTPQP